MLHTLACACSSEVIIRKSRFLGRVEPVSSRGMAIALIRNIWNEHPDATHVCWAMMAGGDSAAVDDGEPSGTAGRPMLEVLRHQKLDGVLATVVRYYGGINLGAGGLVRAYTDAVAQALLSADKVAVVKRETLTSIFPYALEGLVMNRCDHLGIQRLGVARTDVIQMQLEATAQQFATLKDLLKEPGQGRIRWIENV